MVAIFPNVCLWRRSLCSNLAGIDPEKLYRGTFICQDSLCCCIVWPSFLFDCFVNIWATCMNFLGKWFTPPPPSRKLPVRLCITPKDIIKIYDRKPLQSSNRKLFSMFAYSLILTREGVGTIWDSRASPRVCVTSESSSNFVEDLHNFREFS